MSSIIDNNLNKEKCQKFTSDTMVVEMLDLAGYCHDLYGKKILESSFGSGNIISEIVKRYIEDSINAGISPEDISLQIENDIYGIELDADLYQTCINRLNSILTEYRIPAVNWSLYNDDALFFDFHITFDYIIGNPPYISYKDIDIENRDKLRKSYTSCKTGKFDYCYAFIERGINLLNCTGKLVQLVPTNIYKNVFGKKLRELLLPHISIIKEYPGQTLFEGVLTSSTLFLFDNANDLTSITYVDVTKNCTIKIPRDSLGDKWIFSNKIDDSHNLVRFGDRYHASIVVATLLNEAFVLSKEKIQVAGIETALVKKAASPSKMRTGTQEYIIFPYYYNANELMHFEEGGFEIEFPNTVHYLSEFQERLNTRKKDKNTKWFEYGRSQGLSHINQRKILMSTIVTKKVNPYILDENTIPYSGIFITVKKPGYLLENAVKILKSDSFIEYVQSVGISISGNSKRITCKDINDYMFVEE